MCLLSRRCGRRAAGDRQGQRGSWTASGLAHARGAQGARRAWRRQRRPVVTGAGPRARQAASQAGRWWQARPELTRGECQLQRQR